MNFLLIFFLFLIICIYLFQNKELFATSPGTLVQLVTSRAYPNYSYYPPYYQLNPYYYQLNPYRQWPPYYNNLYAYDYIPNSRHSYYYKKYSPLYF